MKAIAVYPGQKDSVHLAELPMPSLDEIPNGRGVLVRLLRVGVDGTDKDGKQVHWTWMGKFDGQAYKIEGSAIADMASYKPMNDHTNELTLMKDGKVVVTGMIKVSKDGKSRVVTTTMTDANGKKHTDKAYYTKA